MDDGFITLDCLLYIFMFLVFFAHKAMFKNHCLACSFKSDGYEMISYSKGEVLFSEKSAGQGSLYYSMTTG